MISVNLYSEHIVPRADICGEGKTEHAPFITFDIGPLSVIIPNAEIARKLAAELHRAADKFDALPAWTAPKDEVML